MPELASILLKQQADIEDTNDNENLVNQYFAHAMLFLGMPSLQRGVGRLAGLFVGLCFVLPMQKNKEADDCGSRIQLPQSRSQLAYFSGTITVVVESPFGPGGPG